MGGRVETEFAFPRFQILSRVLDNSPSKIVEHIHE